MSLSSRRHRRFRWTRALLILGIVLVAVQGVLLVTGPARLSGLLRWSGVGSGAVTATPAAIPLYDPSAALRTLAAAHVAAPTCCTLERMGVAHGDEGCTWQVALWHDGAPMTRVPAACPPGVTPVRGDSSIPLRTLEREKGSEGCTWYAARWSDGITTRVPVSCPDGARVVRRALPAPSCYRAPSSATSVGPMSVSATMVSATTVSPTTAPSPNRLAALGSLFRGCRIISFYGYPDLPVMGTLGSGTPDEVGVRLRDQARAYTRTTPDRPAIPAFHLLAAVAQDSPQRDGSYLLRIPLELAQRWVDVAERDDFLTFLDIQVGHSTPIAELQPLLPLLRNPRVHLALDPEFAMPTGVVPGRAIGSLDAGAINAVQAALQSLVVEDGLPNKILVVHQFQEGMITNKPQLEDQPNVDLVIDMDGFGPPETKIAHYAEFVVREQAEFGGIKLFFGHDSDLLAPDAVLDLAPDVVIYQ